MPKMQLPDSKENMKSTGINMNVYLQYGQTKAPSYSWETAESQTKKKKNKSFKRKIKTRLKPTQFKQEDKDYIYCKMALT